MNKIIKLVSFFIYFTLAAYSTNASAAIVIDFSTGLAGSGGTITYDGTDVIGEDIVIGALLVEGAPTGNGTYTVDALLNFNTALNTISIFGTVNPLVVNATELLTGSFDSFSYETVGGNEVFSASGPDTKSCALLCELGIPSDTAFNFFGFSIESANGSVVSTDFVNTAVVPVPAAAWLFASGVIGLLGVVRRKR